MTPDQQRYDLCVIGAGSAGSAAAQAAHAHGRNVVLVSYPGDFGGTCIRRGCMPAKTLLASTEELGRIEKADGVGVDPGHITVHLAQIVERKRRLVDYFLTSCVESFGEVEVRSGVARFVAEDAIDVDGRRIQAERFIIATGAEIVPPAIDGLRDAGFFTSDDALEMTSVPASLIVLGAGPVGCEFAQYFARLGSRVTLIQAEHEILRNEDVDLSAALHAMLVRDGVTIAVDSTVARFEAAGEGVIAHVQSPAGSRTIAADRVMVAAERRPRTAGLDLARAGIALDGDTPVVDDTLRTSNPRVFAAGDVLGRRCLVHVAVLAGERAEANCFAETPAPVALAAAETHAVYTQPQIAVAGLTEREARAQGRPLRVLRHPFSDIGKAVISAEPEGFIKMLVDEHDAIVGVGIIGAEALDLINEGALIVAQGMTPAAVAQLPHLHPTMGEIYVRIAERFEDEGRGGATRPAEGQRVTGNV